MTRAGRARRVALGGLAATLLLLLLALGGCAAPDPLQLPPPPATLAASYRLEVDGQAVGTAGLEFRHSLEGSVAGAQGSGFALRLAIDGGRTWLLRLWQDSAHRLTFLEQECLGEAGGGQPCPRNDPASFSVLVPDAADAPAYLGLGPFLGKRLPLGSRHAVEVWDPAGPFESRWTVDAADAVDGKPCVWLRADAVATPKTPHPAYPWHGSIKACEGLALPMEVATGPLAWVLTAYDGSGEWVPGPDWHWPQPRAVADGPPCTFRLPPESPTQLTSDAYLAWARTEDDFASAWLASPDRRALPAVGFAREPSPEDPEIARSYNILGTLAFVDDATGAVAPRTMDKQWTRYSAAEPLLPPEGEFHASKELAEAGRVAGERPACVGEADLLERSSALLGLRPTGMTPGSLFVAPEDGRSWTGLATWLWPLDGSAGLYHNHPTVLGPFRPSPWPERIYHTYRPADLGVAMVLFGAADAGTGWVRWAEHEPGQAAVDG